MEVSTEVAPSPRREAPTGEAPQGGPAAALLVLADGLVLRGEAFGARGCAIGEVVFNTGMTGYQEVITDPSYAGQLVTFTYPELGNTGVNSQDQEADRPHGRGVIARQLAPRPSSWRAEQTLPAWLEHHGVVGIAGMEDMKKVGKTGGLALLYFEIVSTLALVIGLGGVYQYQQQQQIAELAELDAAVLADELPLTAYLDQGFNAYLESQQRHQ